MRAALVMEEVLAADAEGSAALQRLGSADIQPIVLARRVPGDVAKVEAAGFRHVVGVSEGGDGTETAHLLGEAAAAAEASLGESFLVCGSLADAEVGLDHGCRVMLVLGDRGLDEVLGSQEPARKSLGIAPDLGMAVRFMIDEAHEDARLGPFPYAQPKLEERPQPRLPSTGDLAKIFALVVIAGVAVALGIAYLLREVYQTVTFPSEAYWLTLQFIPRAWRGLLFVVIGTGAGLAAGFALARLRYR